MVVFDNKLEPEKYIQISRFDASPQLRLPVMTSLELQLNLYIFAGLENVVLKNVVQVEIVI